MPELPWDALISICGHVQDAPSLLSISLTCHTLHIIAVQRLLESQVIALNVKSIHSFRQFIDADREARLPFVRRLSIDLPWCWYCRCLSEDNRPGFIQFVLDLLEQAACLESLVLPHPDETYRGLGCDGRFLTTIIRLATLRELALEEKWTPISEILRNTSSPLKNLRIHPGSITTRSAAWSLFPGDDSLFSLLQHIAPTLETLEVVKQAVSLPHSPPNNLVFPAVRSVKIDVLTQMGSIRTESLVQLFPALDDTLAFYRLDLISSNVEEGREAHEINRESQLRRTWKYLDRVVGDVRLIYALGLVCPVRHLMIDGVSRHTKYQLDDILLNAHPTHLKLTVDLSRGIGVLDDLLLPQVASDSRLTHFVLFLSCAKYFTIAEEDDIAAIQMLEWTTLLAKVIAALDKTRLSHLRVVLQCSTDEWGYTSVPYSEDFMRAARHFGEGPMALQVAYNFMNALPTLQYVFLMTSGESHLPLESTRDSSEHRSGASGHSTAQDQSLAQNANSGEWLASSGWRNTRSMDGIPEQLTSDMVEYLIEAEDLILSRQDHYNLEEKPSDCVVELWD
ncbi:hypothetical protein ONZ51_g2301 [Trametes cubensis]|uniref:F-box domain-containing protein n=1 Tax=Trametes cubensis TaxID=1111947 RepID=A0AAD7XGT0_9APHY|nr:hypothetical protein ONZ51_g2301 [Trametes cubensis]